MQAAQNRFSGLGITVRLRNCFNSSHLATTQQSLNCRVAHVRTVKQFSCLRSSVRRSIMFGPYWLIKSETRYWETSCHLIPAWMSNHMHIKMEWNYLILIHSQTSAVAPLKISNGWGISAHFIMDVTIHPCRDQSQAMGLSCLILPVYENLALSDHVVDIFIWCLSTFNCL